MKTIFIDMLFVWLIATISLVIGQHLSTSGIQDRLFTITGDLPIGSNCMRDDDCAGYPESAFCDELLKICYCKADHEPVSPPEGSGLPIICAPIRNEIGDECLVPNQCRRGEPGEFSDCMPSYDNPDQMICNCTEGNIHEPGLHKCHSIRSSIGDDCEVNAQCRFNMGELSNCFDTGTKKECRCTIGLAIPSFEMDKCLPIRDKLGDTCIIKEQCTLGNPGLHSDCMMKPEDEDDEEDPEDPPEKVCNCTEIAINQPGEHKCHLKREFIGQICEIDAQCTFNMGKLSKCMDTGNCKCLETLAVPNNATTFCLPIVHLIGDPCEESQQCTNGKPGNMSICHPSLDDPENLICNCTDEAIRAPGEHECLKRADFVADPCNVESQCTANLGPLSECIPSENPNLDGKCQCKNGAIPRENATYCLAIRDKLGDECSESLQCQHGTPGNYSICLNDHCQCSVGSTNEPGSHVCRRNAQHVGDGCETNSQCKANLGDLSECLNMETCICTPNNGIPNQVGNFCLPIVNTIYGECLEPQQCQSGIPGNYSSCLPSSLLPGSNICNCTKDAIHQPGRHKCHKVAKIIGDSCEIHEQCQINLGRLADCSQDKGCQCREDYSIPNKHNDKCLQIIDTIGTGCEEDIQCSSGAPGNWSECGRGDDFPNLNVCRCKNEAIREPAGNMCYRKAVHIGEPCAIDLQCSVNIGETSECNNEGKCQCNPESRTVPNLQGDAGTRCIPGYFLIGSSCYDMAQCLGQPGNTSVCTSAGVCDCLRSFTVSVKRDDCLPIRNQIGDICTEPQQCQQGIPGRFSDCILTSLPVGPSTGICNCTSDAINEAFEDKCYLKAIEVGDPCQVGVQCVANLDHSQCLGGICECLRNSTASSDNRKCLEKKYLEQNCVETNQCHHIDNAICYKPDDESVPSTCQCSSGYMKHPLPNFPNVCIKEAVSIGDTCEDHAKQCETLNGATCHPEAKTCECDPLSEVPSRDQKTCLNVITDLHEKCEESIQCQVSYSICLNVSTNPGYENRCVCPTSGFVESSNKCLHIRNAVGDACEESIQCKTGIGSNAECENGVCRCSYPHEFYEDNCYIPAKLGGFCSLNQECRLGVNDLARCNYTSRECACVDTAFEFGDKCWEVKKIGDTCKNDLECTVTIEKPAFCDTVTRTCSCPDGFWSDWGGFRCKGDGNCINYNLTHIIFVLILGYLLQ